MIDQEDTADPQPPGHPPVLEKVGGALSRESSDLCFHDEETTQEQNVQEGGRETRGRRWLLLHPRPQVPLYTTWVGACLTHPRAHSHLHRAPAWTGSISAPVGARPPRATSPPPAAASPVRGKEHLRASPHPPPPSPSPLILRGKAEATSSPAPSPEQSGREREELRPQPPALLAPELPLPSPPLPSAAAAPLVARVSVGSPERVAR